MSVQASFADRLLVWFDMHGRHDLPWQHPRSPYRVWVAEVMLQQTQVTTVIPYFQRFIDRFPDWATLAAASSDDVLQHWAGLGYYARARNLHRAAQAIVDRFAGEIPRRLPELVELPGLGRSTAAAILAQSFDQPQAILDGNVRRVLARHAAVDGWPGLPKVARQLWLEAEARIPQSRAADYTQAIMDLGATLCLPRQPACGRCPVAGDCRAFAASVQARYPAPRPRRARPQRRSEVLLIQNAEGEILFERRPPSGIWGALWCLPIVEEGENWQTVLLERYGFEASAAQSLPSLQHAFTHFDLALTPLKVDADPGAQSTRLSLAESSARRWIKLGNPLPGIPAPILRLIRSLE